MKEVMIIVYQISILTLLGLIGFIAGKTKYLAENAGTVISKVVIKLTAPLLIFITLAGRELDIKKISNIGWVYLLGIIFLLIAFVFGGLISRVMRLEEATSNIYKMHSMFGNVIYLAFPLLSSLYGDDGLFYAVIFGIVNDTLLWTLGIFLVNKHEKSSLKENLKRMINGNTIALSLGLIVLIIKTILGESVNNIPYLSNVSGFIYDTFHMLGSTTFPLSMLFIGLILSETKIEKVSDLLKRAHIFVLSLFRLIILPVLAMFILAVFGKSIDPIARYVIILELAMPCGTIVPALAAEYGSDYRSATENVFITTILGIFTMPLIVYWMQSLIK
ncbi:AEC family transporter [Acetivibrio cellulolyticus]|uniref:AEC family transporter n=1 Tax=Acetivibrio cellulolyticus TaxID=35830 RepID=UPI0001E30582|nr:AEC family transporter [Acetivibrio cellulolyticus]